MNPSGPGALFSGQALIASLTSMIVRCSDRCVRSCWSRYNMDQLIREELVHASLPLSWQKCCNLLFPFCVAKTWPSLFTFSKWFLCLRFVATKWKNDVLRSPSVCHLWWALCFHKSSSSTAKKVNLRLMRAWSFSSLIVISRISYCLSIQTRKVLQVWICDLTLPTFSLTHSEIALASFFNSRLRSCVLN